jgi:hypothetical protein
MSEMLPFLQPYIKEGAVGGSSFPLIWMADRGLPTLFLLHTLRACSAFCSPLYSNACRSVKFLPSSIWFRADPIAFYPDPQYWDPAICILSQIGWKNIEISQLWESEVKTVHIIQMLCLRQA